MPVQVCEILPPQTQSNYVRFVCVIPVPLCETGHSLRTRYSVRSMSFLLGNALIFSWFIEVSLSRIQNSRWI